MRQLNWKRILNLALAGPAIGVLLVLGVFPQGTERFAWIAVNLLWAFVIGKRERDRAFQTGAMTGFIAGASSTLVQGLFASTFLSNNPWVLERFHAAPEGFDMKYFILMLVPFIGVASALMAGLLAHLAARANRGTA